MHASIEQFVTDALVILSCIIFMICEYKLALFPRQFSVSYTTTWQRFFLAQVSILKGHRALVPELNINNYQYFVQSNLKATAHNKLLPNPLLIHQTVSFPEFALSAPWSNTYTNSTPFSKQTPQN